MIIVEGCDLAGKTTWAKEFVKNRPHYKYHHMSVPEKGWRFPEDYVDLIDEFSIYDRFVVSELIYHPIMRKSPLRLNMRNWQRIVRRLNRCNSFLYILCTSWNTVLQRFRLVKDWYIKDEHTLRDIWTSYVTWSSAIHECRDIAMMTADEHLERMLNHLSLGEQRIRDLGLAYRYINGSLFGEVFIYIEDPTDFNTWFIDYFLRYAGIPETYVTFFTGRHEDDYFKVFETLKPKICIAVGNKFPQNVVPTLDLDIPPHAHMLGFNLNVTCRNIETAFVEKVGWKVEQFYAINQFLPFPLPCYPMELIAE